VNKPGLTLIDKQVRWSRLIAVVEERAHTLQRTAFSTVVRESGDLAAGVFDADGRMLAQGDDRHARPYQFDGAGGRPCDRPLPNPDRATRDVFILNDPSVPESRCRCRLQQQQASCAKSQGVFRFSWYKNRRMCRGAWRFRTSYS
jgi:hypothetical protein